MLGLVVFYSRVVDFRVVAPYVLFSFLCLAMTLRRCMGLVFLSVVSPSFLMNTHATLLYDLENRFSTKEYKRISILRSSSIHQILKLLKWKIK